MEDRKTNRQQQKLAFSKSPAGFSLLETLLTIGVVSMVLIVMISVSNIVNLQRNAQNQAIARQLLSEESEALRNASFSDLENRNNTSFIEVAYNSGSWAVESSNTAESAPNVYRVSSATGAANPSRQVVPAGALNDGIFTAAVRIDNAAPAGWKAGFALRYHDNQNHYLLQMTATDLQFNRVVEGVSTTLWSTARTFNKSTWYRLSVMASGSSFVVLVDGIDQTASPIVDLSFPTGQFVLVAMDGAIAEYDTISYTGTAAFFWNFDSGETLGASAKGWKRMGPQDLPTGSTSISITNAVAGAADLKLVALRVQWFDHGAMRSLSNSFYINQNSVAP